MKECVQDLLFAKHHSLRFMRRATVIARPLDKQITMTTPTIKEKIGQAAELANQLRQAIFEINSAVCDEMTNKERQGLSATEEMLLSEMIMPSASAATELLGRLVGLDNIYNAEK